MAPEVTEAAVAPGAVHDPPQPVTEALQRVGSSKIRLARVSVVLDALVTLVLTVGGGIAVLDGLWMRTGWPELWRGAAGMGPGGGGGLGG